MIYMDKQHTVQEQMTINQQMFFNILDVVYDSEYPITLETIAYLTKQPITPKFVDAISALVTSNRIKIHIRDGIVNYQKPATTQSTLLPLPYHLLFDSF